MLSKTLPVGRSLLADALTGAAFGEWHSGVIAADVDRVWDALHRVRWLDLRFTRPLLLARGLGLGGGIGRGCLETFAPLGVLVENRDVGETGPQHGPVETAVLLIGKPWFLVPRSVHVADADAFRAFAEPGWLKYGMEWRLWPLPDGRTFIETSTLCEPTDGRAHRNFAAYWLLIRAGSGAIRREMIAAVGRLAKSEQ